MTRTAVRDWSASLACLVSAGIVATAAFSSDLLFAAVGFWWIAVLGLIALAISLRFGASRWFLLAAPILVSPLVPVGMLLYQCGRGNCL